MSGSAKIKNKNENKEEKIPTYGESSCLGDWPCGQQKLPRNKNNTKNQNLNQINNSNE